MSSSPLTRLRELARAHPLAMAALRWAIGLGLLASTLLWLDLREITDQVRGADAGWLGLARFLLIGSAVGSIFASITFAAAAFSLPMIVDRDVDMITACVTSVNAVLRKVATVDMVVPSSPGRSHSTATRESKLPWMRKSLTSWRFTTRQV